MHKMAKRFKELESILKDDDYDDIDIQIKIAANEEWRKLRRLANTWAFLRSDDDEFIRGD